MTARKFGYFVVLAAMRTGSNLLEEQLSAMPGIESHGELFNPHFFGKPEVKKKWGLSRSDRDKSPKKVIEAMQSNARALPGFRLFHDHDRRVIDHVLADTSAAKIILSRRPVDSYVSLKVARKTDQWWLGDLSSARAAKVSFNISEYVEFLNDLTAFQAHLQRTLQITGQTAFHISYSDLADEDVLAGLGTFLGASGPPDQTKVKAKVQNPGPLRSRLKNAAEAEEALAKLNVPDIDRFPVHEPGRGPGLKLFRAGNSVPLLYMPIRGAWDDPVPDWLDQLDHKGTETGLSQKELRRWKSQNPGHRSFSVLRHPLPRVYDAFCRYILPTGFANYADIRAALIKRYQLPLPPNGPDADYALDTHRTAFLGFLEFLAGNLGGQTSLRVDNTWASQAALLGAIGQFSAPDRVIRADSLAEGLRQLAQDVHINAPSVPNEPNAGSPFELKDVVTPKIEAACAKTYRRDYVMFGFGRWGAT